MQGIIEVISTDKVFRLVLHSKADSLTFFACVILWIFSVVNLESMLLLERNFHAKM